MPDFVPAEGVQEGGGDGEQRDLEGGGRGCAVADAVEDLRGHLGNF